MKIAARCHVRQSGARIALLIALLCAIPQVHAQNNARNVTPFGLPAITLGRLMVPGQGIGILPLGTSFVQVIHTLGQPQQEKRSGLLGKIRHWVYPVDDGSVVVVSGKELVESINVTGNQQSTFATMEGISFGADATTVVTHYGTPEKTKSRTLYYNSRGIAFDLTDQGQVQSITVSIPE